MSDIVGVFSDDFYFNDEMVNKFVTENFGIYNSPVDFNFVLKQISRALKEQL
jgi:hypothetical protein